MSPCYYINSKEFINDILYDSWNWKNIRESTSAFCSLHKGFFELRFELRYRSPLDGMPWQQQQWQKEKKEDNFFS